MSGTNLDGEGEGDDTEECVSLLSQVGDISHAVAEFIAADYSSGTCMYEGLDAHLGFVRDHDIAIMFADIGPDAAFEIQDDGSTMAFSTEAARGFARLVSGTDEIPDEDKPAVFRSLIILFILHEVRHLSQGLAAHSDVQELNEIGQSDLIGLYDLIADIDACKAYAAYRCYELGEVSADEFNSYFVEALALNVSYCIPAFGFPYDKPHKMGRAMGLILMFARSALMQEVTDGGLVGDHIRPITHGLFVRSDKGYASASIQWTEGTCSLLKVEKNPANDWVRKMASAIDSGDIDGAIDMASDVLLSSSDFWGN